MFEREDWTAFRTLDGLCRKAGAPESRLAEVVIKELVDNALDVAGDCELTLSDEGVATIRDRGAGIEGDDEAIARLFSLSRPLASTKYLRLPTRGALGNGLRVVVGAVAATKGDLRVTTGGRTLAISPDVVTGRSAAMRVDESREAGTRVDVRLGDPLGIVPDDLDLAEIAITAARAQGKRYPGKSSPHWYGPAGFHELLLSIPSDDVTVRKFLSGFDGCSAKKIADGFAARPARRLTLDEAARLLERAKAAAREVAPARLGALGESAFPGAYAKEAGFVPLRDREGGRIRLPAVVEAWATADGEDHIVPLLVNGSPCIDGLSAWYLSSRRALTIDGLGLDVLEVKAGFREIGLCVNVMTPYMPVTSDGKKPSLRAYRGLFGPAIARAARRARKLRAAVDGPDRRAEAGRVAPSARPTIKDVVFAHMDELIRMVSGNRSHRFRWRQVFYRMRPIVRDELGEELKSEYFDPTLVNEYEAACGEEPMAVRDPRGTFYMPHHGGESIPLGTVQVEEFHRPEWRFNKILFIEKEGFFDILIPERWPEEHDCALMTSKGQPTKAARDIIDLISRTDEPVQVFCLHDCDAAGTKIYESLQEETRVRRRRNIEIVNLGLDPPEALELAAAGIVEVENVTYAKKQAVAAYVEGRYREWLQTHRVELNAFTTPQLIAWVDGKMAEYEGKLIPPDNVLERSLEDGVSERLRAGIRARVVREARIDDRVAEAFAEAKAGLSDELATLKAELPDRVEDELDEHPRMLWSEAVDGLADEMAAAIPPAEVLEHRLEDGVRRRLRAEIEARVLREARIDDQVDEAMAGLSADLAALKAELPDRVEDELDEHPQMHWAEAVDDLAEYMVEANK